MGQHDLLVATRPAAAIDLDDDEAAHAWICAEVAARASLAGEPTLWFLAADRVDVVECPEPANRERVLSFAFARMAARPDVRRAFWVGDWRAAVSGGRRRTACVLERRADGGWWTAWRLVRFDAERRQSSLVGEWQQAEVAPGQPLEAPFDAWVGPASHAPDATPDVRVGTGELDDELPAEAGALLDAVARLLYRQIAEEGGLDCDLVAVFLGRSFRLWEIRGALPAPFDDLVRTLAHGADAVVVLRPDPSPGADLHIVAAAERSRDRAAHRLTLRRDGARVQRSEFAPLPPGEHRWLGVLPQTPIDLLAEPDAGWSVMEADS